MKIALIIPYFGSFPNYFYLFLKSCEKNENFDWLIFTDNTVEYKFPKNVKKISMQFEECKALIQSKFDFEISLNSYNKLCDYKPAYGYVFDSYLKDYDYWGHCDMDLVFGDLSKFITPQMLGEYDKFFSLGHLTMYKNTEENNKVFMRKLNGEYRYREVFTTDVGCAFDEWYPKSVNDIYIEYERPFLKTCNCADIYPYKSNFVLDLFDLDKRAYYLAPENNNIFKWENGKVIRYYKKDGKVCSEEHMYVHLQKRKMKDCLSSAADNFVIVPNKFIDSVESIEKLLTRSRRYAFLNFQFFRVKYKSLKSRIKKRNWKGLFNRYLKRR